MNTHEIIAALEQERDRLNEAIAALSNSKSKSRGKREKRHLTAAARHKISVAQKKRWAEWKKKS